MEMYEGDSNSQKNLRVLVIDAELAVELEFSMNSGEIDSEIEDFVPHDSTL